MCITGRANVESRPINSSLIVIIILSIQSAYLTVFLALSPPLLLLQTQLELNQIKLMTKTYTSCIPFHSVSCKMQIIHKLQFNEMKEKCNCILCIHIIMKESKCLLPQSNSYMQLYFFLSLAPSFLHTYYKQFFL